MTTKPKECDLPEGQRLCPKMSGPVPGINPLSGEFEVSFQYVPCATENCDWYIGADAACAIWNMGKALSDYQENRKREKERLRQRPRPLDEVEFKYVCPNCCGRIYIETKTDGSPTERTCDTVGCDTTITASVKAVRK